jgi:hypothetical protein
MGVLISQTLSEIHFHKSIVVNTKIKFSKHLEDILEIFIENIKYGQLDALHLKNVYYLYSECSNPTNVVWLIVLSIIIGKGLDNETAKFYRCVITQAITKTITRVARRGLRSVRIGSLAAFQPTSLRSSERC